MKQKLRILLTTDKDVHRKFYWFEVKGQDFYWGTSSDVKHAFCQITCLPDGQIQIKTPEHFKEMEESRTKYSYHESGQFHIQNLEAGVYAKCKLSDIWESNQIPVARLFSVLTKPFLNYPINHKNPTKGNALARSILLKGESAKNRLLADFFIVKSMNDPLPKPVYKLNDQHIHCHYYQITETIILCMRFIKLSNLENWHEDKEFVVLRNNMTHELPYI